MITHLTMRFLYAGIAVLILLSAGLLAAVQFVDWNAYRTTIATTASEQLGLSVDLSGPVGVSLIPGPTLEVADVTVRPLSGDSGVVITRADRIALSLSFSGLLAGAIEVENLELIGLELTLEENAVGDWSLKGWPNDDEGSTSSAVQLDDVTIEDGRFTFNRFSGAVHSLDRVTMDLKGRLPTGPVEWAGEARKNGETLAVSGRLRPLPSETGQAFLLRTELGSLSAEISGRVAADGTLSARSRGEGEDAADVVKRLLMLARADGEPSPENAGEEGPADPVPFSYDVRLDGGTTSGGVEATHLRIGQSAGRMDGRYAKRAGQWHVIGEMPFSLLDVGELQSLALQFATGGNEASGGPMDLPVTGSLDLSAEAVRTPIGLLQQMSATLARSSNRIVLSRGQALLPGASRITVSGEADISSDPVLSGRLHFDSGNLRDLMSAFGADLEGSVTAGRLNTASLDGELRLDGTGWALGALTGTVDTGEISGALSGRWSAAPLETLSLTVDAVSLDALLVESQPRDRGTDTKAPADTLLALIAALPDDSVAFELNVGQLSYGGARFADISASGAASNQRLRIDALEFGQGGGSLEARLDVSRADGDWTLDAAANGANLPMRLMVWAAPAAETMASALGQDIETLSLAATGPLDATVFSGGLVGDRGAISFDGRAHMGRADLLPLEVRGQFDAADFSLFLPTWVPPGADMPGRLSLSASRSTSQDPYMVQISGSLADTQLVIESDLRSENEWNAVGRFNHPQAGALLSRLGQRGRMPYPFEAVSLAFDANMNAGVLALNSLELRNGATEVRGGLTWDDGQRQVSGQLALIGLDMSTYISGRDQSPTASAAAIDMPFNTLSLDLNITDMKALGQSITAPSAQITSDGDRFIVDLGAGARLGDGPLTSRAEVALGASADWSMRVNATRLDWGAAFGAAGVGRAIVGPGLLDATLSGRGFSGRDMRASLSGSVRLDAPGGQLAFLDVVALSQSVARMDRPRDLLGAVARSLAGGQSRTQALDARVSVADGIALIERFHAEGQWGVLSLDGQVNMVDERLDLKGVLSPSLPAGAPDIPLTYRGDIDQPQSRFASQAFERFALGRIDQRVRDRLLRTRGPADGENRSPGGAILGLIVGGLDALRERQRETQPEEEDDGSDP